MDRGLHDDGGAVADMVDQGRLVPSFLSYLKISMCTGRIFTVHKHSYYCSYGPGGAQEKNTFLLPMLVPYRGLKCLLAMYVCMRLEWRERYPGESVPHGHGAAAP